MGIEYTVLGVLSTACGVEYLRSIRCSVRSIGCRARNIRYRVPNIGCSRHSMEAVWSVEYVALGVEYAVLGVVGTYGV